MRLAPAKVNLTLAVLGVRRDGFHDLHSVMVPLDLADRLSLAVLPPGGEDTLHVVGHDPGPAADNLVLRAIAAARRAAAAGLGPSPSPRRPSPPGSTSGSRWPRGSPAAPPTPPRPRTPRWTRGA